VLRTEAAAVTNDRQSGTHHCAYHNCGKGTFLPLASVWCNTDVYLHM